MVRRIWSRYPPSDGWMAGLAIVMLCSLAFGGGGLLLGEQWSGIVEDFRIGNGHLSYRIDRLPWVRYQWQMFAFIWVLFWIIAAVQYRMATARFTKSES